MKQRRIGKGLLTVCAAVLLLVFAAVFAWAVPARPGSGLEGERAACHSHAGELVTLDKIPARRSGNRAPSISPVEKSIPLLTIVVGFADVPYENGYNWSDTVFSGDKSLSAYYSDMSFGQFTFIPAAESSAYGVGDNTNTADALNDGVIHVKLSAEHEDWAGDDEYPALGAALINAIEIADAYVDFASFDEDGNGTITENELAVGFVIAGYEAAATSTYPMGINKYFWAHAWSIDEIIDEYDLDLAVPTPDNTEVSAYIGIAEKLEADEQEPISVLAHELGHYLGLPDLYDTSDNTAAKWGKYDVSVFSVMSGGSWGEDPDGGYIPYSMDVWSRYALGWCTPQTAEQDGDYSVAAQSYSADDAFAAVYLPTQREGEYYLLENRQFTKWDAGMASDYAGGGIIVWHIDDAVFEQYYASNEVNDTFHRPAVMPLYPEKKNNEYTYIGNTSSVLITRPFYSVSGWNAMFDQDTPLNLPLYGQGADANNRAARTLSGLKLRFLDESAPVMTVYFSAADHVHFLDYVNPIVSSCQETGMRQHWLCTYCGTLFADAAATEPVTTQELVLPLSDHIFESYDYNNDATCFADGTETAACVFGCGETDTRPKAGTKLSHTFTAYRYNNDATCTADGTETAACDRGCGETDTRPKSGTKLPHTYGEPVWRWMNDYSSATATFTCACGDTQIETAAAPAKTEVSAATATADQVVIYTDSVTFGGRTYTGTSERVSVPGTATGTPQQPSQSGDLCPLDGKDHGSSFGGRLTRFFHSILAFFQRLFGKR